MIEGFINVDLAIIFDIGDYRRVGEVGKHIYDKCISICIDHHPERNNNPFVAFFQYTYLG